MHQKMLQGINFGPSSAWYMIIILLMKKKFTLQHFMVHSVFNIFTPPNKFGISTDIDPKTWMEFVIFIEETMKIFLNVC